MKKYRLNKGFITQKIGNKTTIFSGEDSMLYTLNDTASFIFNGLKLEWDNNRIAKGLMEKYVIKREQAFRDVEELIKQLKKKGIVV